MRDKRFVAEHRGGPLKKEQHRQLIRWAYLCSEHVLNLFGDVIDERIIHALDIAKKWEKGEVSVGEARKSSVRILELARELSNPTSIAVARSVGHTVATAHMADHSLGGALYALKAIKSLGQSIDDEREWQNSLLPQEIRDLVLENRPIKEKPFGLL
ncbi:MAG: putative immunity protein [Candidatus Sericytochromatia bacterium]